MARRPRQEVENGLHHVTARAPKGLVLFEEDADWRVYLDLMGEEVTKRAWSLRTYCLMTNHLHLLVCTPVRDLSDGIKTIHERFARWRHWKYDGHGHVFGRRYDNRVVRTADHEVACLRYIARNPVKAGLCPSAGDWPWSGHRFLAGDAVAPGFLDIDAALGVLGRSGYRELVGTEDPQLLNELMTKHPRTWVAHAIVDHGMTCDQVGHHAGWSRRTVYRRLAEQTEPR